MSQIRVGPCIYQETFVVGWAGRSVLVGGAQAASLSFSAACRKVFDRSGPKISTARKGRRQLPTTTGQQPVLPGSPLNGSEFYDAAVDLSDIAAVIIRAEKVTLLLSDCRLAISD